MFRVDYFIWCVLLSSIWPGFSPIGPNRIWWGGIVQFFTKLDLVDDAIDETATFVSQAESFESNYLIWHVIEVFNVAFISTIYWHWAHSCYFESIRKLLLLSSPSSRHYNWCLNLDKEDVDEMAFFSKLLFPTVHNMFHPSCDLSWFLFEPWFW